MEFEKKDLEYVLGHEITESQWSWYYNSYIATDEEVILARKIQEDKNRMLWDALIRDTLDRYSVDPIPIVELDRERLYYPPVVRVVDESIFIDDHEIETLIWESANEFIGYRPSPRPRRALFDETDPVDEEDYFVNGISFPRKFPRTMRETTPIPMPTTIKRK